MRGLGPRMKTSMGRCAWLLRYVSFYLGEKAPADDETGPPDMKAVRPTIRFALATGRTRCRAASLGAKAIASPSCSRVVALHASPWSPLNLHAKWSAGRLTYARRPADNSGRGVERWHTLALTITESQKNIVTGTSIAAIRSYNTSRRSGRDLP